MNDNPMKRLCSGGCGAKLGPGFLADVLAGIPRPASPDLLVGFDSFDDAAVYRLSDSMAVVQTLDFFTPMVEDPYTFGQIAAANAMSDVYAMGGEVRLALNIVCFPQELDRTILAEILKGGADKVLEAGGVLCGGHSINDTDIKYGLSVTGLVNPARVLRNDGCREGDALILTKPLGVGITLAAKKAGEADDEAYAAAVESMTTLNKHAAEIIAGFNVSACTDVTGFGLLGHLREMLRPEYSAEISAKSVPVIPGVYEYAKDFLTTAAGQRNRNYLTDKVRFDIDDYAMEEILFDPQTSGGLLISAAPSEAAEILNAFKKLSLRSGIIGSVTQRQSHNIIVKE